jgi:hypothetical protein
MAARRQPQRRDNMKTTASRYSDIPMSRGEVLERDRELDERMRKARAERDRAQAKARETLLSQGPKPLTQQDVDELEREREERHREFLAAHEARRAERLKQTAAEENARNRRVPARS